MPPRKKSAPQRSQPKGPARPSTKADDDALAIEVCERWRMLGHITTRRMFGGYGIWCDGLFFALIAYGQVYLKVSDETRGDFETRGLQPFEPFEGRPMSYFPLPPDIWIDSEELPLWAARAIEVARLAASRTRKPRRKTQSEN